jgi:hypothetical protein
MTDDRRNDDGLARTASPGPSTNREAVPDGLEGSIMEPEQGADKQRQQRGDPREKPHGDPLRGTGSGTADRAEGNERRSDEN